MHFPSYVYLWCLFQGFHLNRVQWAAPGSTEVALSCAWEGWGLGKPWCLPSCRLPASRWLPLSDGSERHVLPRAPQKVPAKLSACLTRDSSASKRVLCQPASPNEWHHPLGRALQGSEAETCAAVVSDISAEPSWSQMLPELWKWNQTSSSLLFSSLTKDAHYLKHPEHFCLFVFKVRVRIQTWQLVPTSFRSWTNAPGPTNLNSGNILGSSLQQTKISTFRQPNDTESCLQFLQTLQNTYRKLSMSQGLQI